MMGRRGGDQASLFYEFRLEDRVPKNHLLRRINAFVTPVLIDVREQLGSYYSEIGRPSVDPELMLRMLIVGYCYGLRSERKLTQEVELHLAYRWFCRLDLDDKVPHHSTFSENRLHRFRESDVFRHIFERVVAVCMAAGLVKGEGFAVDASVMEANASRYHGKAPAEIDWTEKQRQKRAVAEYLAALKAEAADEIDAADDGDGGGSESKRPRRYERKPPKVISPSDPQSAWTAKANKRVQFGYGLNYMIDIEYHGILDVDHIVQPVAELHSFVGLGRPCRLRVRRRDHLGRLALVTARPFALGPAAIAIICGIDRIRRFSFECCQILSHSTLLTLLLGPIDLGRRLTVIAARIRLHDARVHRKSLALDQAGRHTGRNDALEYVAKDIALPEPVQPVLRERRMVRNLVVEIEPAEPPIGQMQLDFLGQLAL